MWPPGFMNLPGVGGWGGSCETGPVVDAATFPASDFHPVHPSRSVNQLRTIFESSNPHVPSVMPAFCQIAMGSWFGQLPLTRKLHASNNTAARKA